MRQIAPRVQATVVVAKDFDALCAEAALIFVGTVTKVESRWSDPQRQAIETEVTFGDLTWLRGGAPAPSTTRNSPWLKPTMGLTKRPAWAKTTRR